MPRPRGALTTRGGAGPLVATVGARVLTGCDLHTWQAYAPVCGGVPLHYNPSVRRMDVCMRWGHTGRVSAGVTERRLRGGLWTEEKVVTVAAVGAC